MKALLDHGANVNAQIGEKLWFRSFTNDYTWVDPAGATAFWRAAQSSDTAAMKLLVEHGADPKIATKAGDTPLMAAAGIGWAANWSVNAPVPLVDAVKYCVELGNDVNAADNRGYTRAARRRLSGQQRHGQLPGVAKAPKSTPRARPAIPPPIWPTAPRASASRIRRRVALLEKLGSPNSHNCRSDQCVVAAKANIYDRPLSAAEQADKDMLDKFAASLGFKEADLPDGRPGRPRRPRRSVASAGAAWPCPLAQAAHPVICLAYSGYRQPKPTPTPSRSDHPPSTTQPAPSITRRPTPVPTRNWPPSRRRPRLSPSLLRAPRHQSRLAGPGLLQDQLPSRTKSPRATRARSTSPTMSPSAGCAAATVWKSPRSIPTRAPSSTRLRTSKTDRRLHPPRRPACTATRAPRRSASPASSSAPSFPTPPACPPRRRHHHRPPHAFRRPLGRLVRQRPPRRAARPRQRRRARSRGAARDANDGKRNLASLAQEFNPAGYLDPTSDIVALMTFEHQTQMTNLITRLAWESRIADAARQASDIEAIVDYMLFADEAPLNEPVEGVSTFTETFPKRGPRDRQGRSLRDFDLHTRLFRYPLSYMIYSPPFDALPDRIRARIYRRLFEVRASRAAIEILRETKPDLPEVLRSVMNDLPDALARDRTSACSPPPGKTHRTQPSRTKPNRPSAPCRLPRISKC